MPRWTTRQLVTKYMANSGGDAGGGRSRPGKRAGLIMWVASATQPACDPDRKQLDDFRAWARPMPFRRGTIVKALHRPPAIGKALRDQSWLLCEG
jgi:hypothetical protein